MSVREPVYIIDQYDFRSVIESLGYALESEELEYCKNRIRWAIKVLTGVSE